MPHEQYYQQFLLNNPYPRTLKQYDGSTNTRLINFSSNDYLGLTKHPLLIARSQEFVQRYGAGSASSRLVVGNSDVYEKLEQQIAHAIGKPAALILGTGFQTNISILEALLDSRILGCEPLVLSDRLCHASLLTGVRYLTRVHRFQHNHLNHLRQLLEKYADSSRAKFILVESIYSMDGDQADLVGLIQLAKEHRAFLYVDDAHAVGMTGSSGWGIAADHANSIDIVMGTFSKALGSFGGYVACSETLRHYLINQCKGFIYSTGLPPAVLGAISAAIELVPHLELERERVARYAAQLRAFFKHNGLDSGGSTTHIVPWIIGDAQKTVYASGLLEQLGILGVTIRPPSVLAGKSRIRFCLSACHRDEDIERLMEAIQKVERKL